MSPSYSTISVTLWQAQASWLHEGLSAQTSTHSRFLSHLAVRCFRHNLSEVRHVPPTHHNPETKSALTTEVPSLAVHLHGLWRLFETRMAMTNSWDSDSVHLRGLGLCVWKHVPDDLLGQLALRISRCHFNFHRPFRSALKCWYILLDST